MKSNKFTINLVGGAAASLAAGCLIPNSEPAINNTTTAGVNFTMTKAQPVIAPELIGTSTDDSVRFQMSDSPEKWSGKLDREFRTLVLNDVEGTISSEQTLQLKQLEVLRSRLVSPRSADEISFQLKRDRFLEKMSETMGKYVQFKEATSQKRTRAA